MSDRRGPSKPTLYLSFSIEADGPSPEYNSMRSFGLVAVAEDGREVAQFVRHILPREGAVQDRATMTEFWTQQPEAWAALQVGMCTPEEFASDVAAFYQGLLVDWSLVWVAPSAAPDWRWLSKYYDLYKKDGYPNIGCTAVCISTLLDLYLSKHPECSRAQVRREFAGGDARCCALDDARAQASIFARLREVLGDERQVAQLYAKEVRGLRVLLDELGDSSEALWATVRRWM